MQSSPTAPFVFYVQSEISQAKSCPFPEWGCSRFDLDRGIDHLRMFNVSEFIVRSESVKAVAAAHPGLIREAVIQPYEIFRVKKNTGTYATALSVVPYLVVGQDWKEMAYRWFKRARPEDPVPVFADTLDDEGRLMFGQRFTGLPTLPPIVPLKKPPVLHESLEADRVTLSGCRPGHPVLIRISYHPRWRALTGERIWLAGPSFMLIFPRGERVELVYGGAGPSIAGQTLTGIGLILSLVALTPLGRAARSRLSMFRFFRTPRFPFPSAGHSITLQGSIFRRSVLITALAATVAGVTAVAITSRRADADGVYRKAQQLYDRGQLDKALQLFQVAVRLAPLSNTAIHSTYFEAIIRYKQQDWRDAEGAFQRLVDTFPEADAASEALYHVGLCRERLGRDAEAVEAWKETQRRFPGTLWSQLSQQKVLEAVRPQRGRT